jgi:AAA+ ATPase superfamily predicted ATPase
MHVELTIIRVFRYLSIEGILILKEWFNKNEIECYRDAVNMIQDYIGSYEKKYSMVKVEKNDNDTMIHLLEDIYHDLIMRHSNRRKRAVIFDVGVDLVNAGIALLPQKYKGKHKHI